MTGKSNFGKPEPSGIGLNVLDQENQPCRVLIKLNRHDCRPDYSSTEYYLLRHDADCKYCKDKKSRPFRTIFDLDTIRAGTHSWSVGHTRARRIFCRGNAQITEDLASTNIGLTPNQRVAAINSLRWELEAPYRKRVEDEERKDVQRAASKKADTAKKAKSKKEKQKEDKEEEEIQRMEREIRRLRAEKELEELRRGMGGASMGDRNYSHAGSYSSHSHGGGGAGQMPTERGRPSAQSKGSAKGSSSSGASHPGGAEKKKEKKPRHNKKRREEAASRSCRFGWKCNKLAAKEGCQCEFEHPYDQLKWADDQRKQGKIGICKDSRRCTDLQINDICPQTGSRMPFTNCCEFMHCPQELQWAEDMILQAQRRCAGGGGAGMFQFA